MDALVFPVVDALSVLTLAGAFLTALLLAGFIPALHKVHTFVSRRGILLMLIVSVIASGGSLFLSEIAGWTPCKLCWFQRIFMYPQVVLLGIALWKRDRNIAPYIFALSLIGAAIALFHYREQVIATFFTPPVETLEPCDETGVSCSKTYTFRFGYITVPMMAFTAFVLNTLGSIIMMRKR